MPLVLLASASERRRQLMSEFLKNQAVDLEFYVLKAPEEEASSKTEVRLQVEKTCIRKAFAAANEIGSEGKNGPDIILVSDTLVEDPDDEMVALGKPKDKSGAAFGLVRLSGRRHRVWSSTAIIDRKIGDFEVGTGWMATIWTDYSIVEFEEIEEEAMCSLIASQSWKGKAGGYDLAGDAGEFAKIIEGEEVTVLGFSNRAIGSLDGFLN